MGGENITMVMVLTTMMMVINKVISIKKEYAVEVQY